MLENKEGQTVPEVIFHTRQGTAWVDVSTDDLFNNKTVIVFSLPGAFTPTCSASHAPRYDQLAATFKAQGVDDIICFSVNDTFVMNEWAKSQQANNVRFIPDGNGEFTEKMGFLVDKDAIGFGKRSWRYSMLVKNGVIEKMFIEPEVKGDPYEVSDADTMLNYIAPDINRPVSASIMTRPGCPFCTRAKKLLSNANIEYEELVLNKDYTSRSLLAIAGSESVPQVFIDGDLVGGSTDLADWLSEK